MSTITDYIIASGNEEYMLGTEFDENLEFLDTGSYSLNGLLSGSIYGGMPLGMIVGLAGDYSSGKSFICLTLCRKFLEKYTDGMVFYFESEKALTKNVITQHKLDQSNFVVLEIDTVEKFKEQALKVINKAGQEKNKKQILFVLDSLGNLSTTKEKRDSMEGNETRDMTRTQLIKSLFRTISIEMGKIKASMLITNHVYDIINSPYPMKKISGGSGFTYACSIILMMKKSKEKTDKEVIGNAISITLDKSRISREYKSVDMLILHTSGIDRYYGLLPIAEQANLIKKVGKRWQFNNGVAAFENAIRNNGKKFWSIDVLEKIEEYVHKNFSYSPNIEYVEEEIEEENVVEEKINV
jgi:RecA/RadA recombinase